MNSGKKLSAHSSKSSSDLRQKTKVKLTQSTSVFGSHRIKSETPRPTWNDVKTGFNKHFKIKRWNSIGSWVF